jgi:hypothetical protein
MRLRASDGFSHARSLAFMLSLVLVQGIVTMVGLAQAFGSETLGDCWSGSPRAWGATA